METTETTKCPRCWKDLPLEEFTVKRTGKINKTCKSCCKVQVEFFMEYNRRHGLKYYRMRSVRVQEVKAEVIGHYGGRCKCCGETDIRFLSLDHKNGDGAEHRRQLAKASGSRIWYWAKNNGFPETFQVLCYNCNLAKGRKRACPHESDDLMRFVSAC
jgi:hypothetical protein